MIISKIKIHPFFYIVLLITVLTGHFRTFSSFMFLIVVHEFGHIIAALFFHWKIEKVILLPFGGLTLFHEKVNRPIYEELLIALLGPVFQVIFYSLWICWMGKGRDFSLYHYGLLFFNLLPIYPLDGFKVITLLLSYFFPFFKSYQIGLVLSIFCLCIFSYFYHSFFYILVLLCLVKSLFLFYHQIPYIIEQFLFERYQYSFSFKRRKLIHGRRLDKMFRDCYHLFLIDGYYHTEREVLKSRFHDSSILK